MIQRLAEHFQVDAGELRRTLILGTVLFGLGSSYTLVKTARDAEFLAELPVRVLPYVLITVGVLSLAASVGFARLTRRLASWESLAVGATAGAISLMAFSHLLGAQERWVTLAFYLWVNVCGLLLLSQFWAFAASLSNPREARRTFGAIGVGGLLGGLFGGLIAAPLAQQLSLAALVRVAAVLLVATVPLLRSVVGRGILGTPEREGEEPGSEQPLFCRRYARWLVLITLCGVMVSTLVDFQFKSEIQRRYTDRGQLAAFLGAFHSMVNVSALILQLFLTRGLMARLGSVGAAAILPAGLAVGAGFTVVLPGLVAATASRLWDQAMGLSVARVAGEIFYFPLQPGLRRRLKAFIVAGVERLGEGVAGLLIIGIGAAAGESTRTLGFAIAALIAVWVVAWLGVRRGYVVELERNVRRLSLGHDQMRISLREAGVIREVSRQLESPYERVVLQSVAMLEESAPEVLVDRVVELLNHGSAAVRIRALQWIRSRRPEGLEERVSALMRDPDSVVQGEALVTYCALRRVGIVDTLEQVLRSDDAGLRTAAIRCLAEYAGPSEEGRALAVLEDVLKRAPARDRGSVAEGLGRRSDGGPLFELLAPLLADPDVEVRRKGLIAAGLAGRREHVLRLIEALAHKEMSAAAHSGLAAFGDRVVGTLGDYLNDTGVDLELRWRIPYILSDIRTQEAVNALFRARNRSDVRLGYRVLKASNRIRAADGGIRFPRALVTEDIEYDLRGHLWAFVHHRTVGPGRGSAAERLMVIALDERMEQSLNRIFRRLGLLYPPNEMLAAYRGITLGQAKPRGNAVEYLENVLQADHRGMIMPLIEQHSDSLLLSLASRRYNLRVTSYEDALAEILQGDDPWLRTCALYVVGARRDHTLAQHVEASLGTSDPRVRDAARWARLALSEA